MSKKNTFDFDQELDKCRTVEDLMGKDGLIQSISLSH